MFVSYVLEAFIATVIILETCWHNWKYRDTDKSSQTKEEKKPLEGRFVEATNVFLDSVLVFLLSLVVALTVVGSHESVIYNGVVTNIACYVAGNALLTVAALPRKGSGRTWTFWLILLSCMLILTVVTRTSGQYLVGWGDFTSEEFLGDLFVADWLEVIERAWADQSMSATSVIDSLGHQGIPTAKKYPFNDSTCLLYSLLYLPELGWMQINYLEASWMLEAI
jgi:hypothetical protein